MKFKLLVISALVSGLAGVVQAAPLTISAPWIRAMPPNSRVIPIFFNLHNPSPEDRVLTAIHSDLGEVEIHETVTVGDMKKMQPINALTIAAGKMAALKPGGYHGMMSHFTLGVPAEGEFVLLTLRYANGESQEVNVEVVRREKASMLMTNSN